MGGNDKVDSRETGLEIGLLLGRFFLDTDDLHYGVWSDNLEVKITNFGKAQENHSRKIISHIPENVETILDVGAGAGSLAKKLLAEGYSVDCVSPSSFLSDKLTENLGEESKIYSCRYEDLETDKRYDLVLFSESFQYIDIASGLNKTIDLLNHGGHLLICDFFRTDAEGKNPLQGGHKLSVFLDTINGIPFEKRAEADITEDTAPTIELLGAFLRDVAPTIRDLGADYFSSNYPKLSKLIGWKFRKRFEKIDRNYFSGNISAEAYLKYQTYRLFLYKKIPTAPIV